MAAVAISAIGAASAQAGVSTTVRIADTGIQNTGISMAARQYNPGSSNYLGFQIGNGQGSAFTAPGDSGVAHCDVFNCYTPYAATATSGTLDQTGTATSAFDKISGTSPDGFASATAASDLATGTLHATASGAFGFVYQGEDQYAEGSAAASQSDGLHFIVLNASASTQTQIQIEFTIDGAESTTHAPPFGYQNGNTLYWLNLGGTSIRDSSIWTPGNQYPDPTYTSPQVFNGFGDVQLLSVDRLANTPTDTDFIATYQLTGSAIDTSFFDVLATSCGDGVTCDFANTAKVRFILPTNVSFTSDSGVFLTASAAAGGVPEPGAWALMILGFAGLGAQIRRVRHRIHRTAPVHS